MTKSYWLIIVAMVVLASASGGAMWLLRDRFAPPTVPAANSAQADFEALVNALGQDDRVVCYELHDLITTTNVKLSANDAIKRGKLTNLADDPKELLAIDHVQEFLRKAAKGENIAYHFVAPEKQKHLKDILGDEPSPAKVVFVRNELVKLAVAFAHFRQPAVKWSVEVKAEKGEVPPPMPFLDMIRTATTFLPADTQPVVLAEPKIGAFSGAEAELLVQLDRYFNSAPVLQALPKERYPNLYHDGRLLPIPRALLEYRQPIVQGINIERRYLTGDDNLRKQEEIDDIFRILERFFLAVEGFKLPA